MNGVVKNLDLIANRQSGEIQRQAGLLHAQLHYGGSRTSWSAACTNG
jgi:hypothetical protein